MRRLGVLQVRTGSTDGPNTDRREGYMGVDGVIELRQVMGGSWVIMMLLGS